MVFYIQIANQSSLLSSFCLQLFGPTTSLAFMSSVEGNPHLQFFILGNLFLFRVQAQWFFF